MKGQGSSRVYGMPERSDRLDFYIRDEATRNAITEPHKHEYFQIQINLGGDTVQQIGAATRPFPTGALAFVLPHRVHMIPHPEAARFIVINFSGAFLGASLDTNFGANALAGSAGFGNNVDLDDVPLSAAPELAPFRFQEQTDFILGVEDLKTVAALAGTMIDLNRERAWGVTTLLRGYLLQLIGLVCARHATALQSLAETNVAGAGRKEALTRVARHIRDHLASDGLTLSTAATAAFLSPSYLAHLIKKETGRTFIEWVTDERMALAKSLLTHSPRRIKDIAFAVGYADEAYFARRFRQAVGHSPSAFRSVSSSLDTAVSSGSVTR